MFFRVDFNVLVTEEKLSFRLLAVNFFTDFLGCLLRRGEKEESVAC